METKEWSERDIAELAIQSWANWEDDPETYSPPWEGSLDGWRHSASEAGDLETVEAIDTVPDADAIYEEAGRRLRDPHFADGLDGLSREQIVDRLVAR